MWEKNKREEIPKLSFHDFKRSTFQDFTHQLHKYLNVQLYVYWCQLQCRNSTGVELNTCNITEGTETFLLQMVSSQNRKALCQPRNVLLAQTELHIYTVFTRLYNNLACEAALRANKLNGFSSGHGITWKGGIWVNMEQLSYKTNRNWTQAKVQTRTEYW